jgi:peroxiredoxin
MTGWPYPAPADCGGARHLTVDTAIPDVALPATSGAETSFARLHGLSVIFIYPWTGRPGLSNPPDWDTIPGAHGSTPEAEGFRDLYSEFRAEGAEIFGLSCQDQSHQREFAARLGLPYALLSDRGQLVRRALALPAFETGGTAYLKRLTLVVRDGRLVRAFYPVHPPDKHAGEVLSWLRAPVPSPHSL